MAIPYTVLDVGYYNVIGSWAGVSSVIDGVIIRAGYRSSSASDDIMYEDDYFESSANGASTHDIPMGFYFSSNAISVAEAEAEAEYCVRLIESNGYEVTLPIFIDTEYSSDLQTGRADNLSVSERTNIVKAFCEKIEELGYLSGVYAYDDWYAEHLSLTDDSDGHVLTEFKLWVANYDMEPVYVDNPVGWQYTTTGSIQGVNAFGARLSEWYEAIGKKNEDAYYYPEYTGYSNSLYEALEAVGCIETSNEYIRIIAEANGIIYTNSSDERDQMLYLLKAGLLIDPSGNDTTAPVIEETENNCMNAVISVTDDVFLYSVYRDEVQLDRSETPYSYIEPEGTTFTFTASDVAGNTSSHELVVKGHTYETYTVEPTCTEDGYTLHECKYCGDSYKEDIVSMLGHNWEEYEEVEPTCTENGYIVYKCSRCGETYRQYTDDATGHDYEYEFDWTDDYWTCWAHFVCKDCGLEVDENCTVTTWYSTDICINDGYVFYCAECTVDGVTYQNILEFPQECLGHDWETIYTKEPTCTEDGYSYKYCQRCYIYSEEDVVPAYGHDWVTEIIPPTCTTDGYTMDWCKRCEEIIKYDYIDAYGHDYVLLDWFNNDYIDDGYETYSCTRCGDTYTDVIDALVPYFAMEVKLLDTNLYGLPVSIHPDTVVTGTFYVWDLDISNRRMKVTNRLTSSPLPGLITGWVDVSEFNRIIKGNSGTKYKAGDCCMLKNIYLYTDPFLGKTNLTYTGRFYVSSDIIYNNKVPLCKLAEEIGIEDDYIGWIDLKDF